MGTDAPRSKRHSRLRPLFITLGIVVSVALVAGAVGAWTVMRAFPDLSGDASIAGLSADVSVYRDDAGIPQIVASTADDLFAAQGYVHAQDRFWEMDFRRHMTSGRLSELFGQSQVETDTFIRTLGWRAIAEEEVKLLDPVSLGYYQAYADGVNAYLETHHGADLSLEYVVLGLQNPGYKPEPWTPADSVAWLKAMAWDLRSNLDDEIDRALLTTTLPPSDVAALHPGYPYDTHPTIVGGPAAGNTIPVLPAAGQPAPPAEATPTPAAAPVAQVAATAAATPAAHLRTVLASLPELLGPAGGEIGSNSWVVSGALTDTGAPILANDPHLGPAMPSVWYQVGLRCAEVTAECPFDVAGYSFSGMPGVIIGHNSRVAWGFTNLGPDVADLYLEKVVGDNYLYDGVEKPLTVRNETITVAGGQDVEIEIRSTEHGPIISGDGADADDSVYAGIANDFPDAAGLDEEDVEGAPEFAYELSLQWTALTPGRTPASIFAMNRATDWPSFRAAAALFEVPSQNLVYADVDGNIGYQAPGLIPIRSSGDGTVPVPGWSSAYSWTGFIPFEELPQVFNPPSGYIVTANNAPVGADYPYLITQDWDLGYRADRITDRLEELIASGTPLTTELMSEIQADNFSAIAARLVPVLRDVDVDGPARQAQALFDDWDYELDPDSAAAAYFNVVWRQLLADVFDGVLPEGTELTGGDRSFAIITAMLDNPDSPRWNNPNVGVIDRESMLERVLTRSAKEAAELMGPSATDWKWGSIHTLEIRNASFGESGVAPIEWLFNRGPYALGGGSSVVNANGSDTTQGYVVDWVPSMRQVISLADWDDSTWINLTGASGHAFHPNYTDQTPLWQHNETRPWPYSQERVAAQAKDTLTLSPENG
ncbi:penicillin acylase family protein [Glaciibacter superstes]|uniref:penicillin acylase family protein n=1 Tax=Glaciibacter superstes TaxID=501023 RepID=UPI0003B63905|nr:penicillin acylase family protein [Glaciibacter superstes]